MHDFLLSLLNVVCEMAPYLLLGVPLPLCSCGVIPTAIGLRNEKASKGAIASFLIATPQTGIDSILATFSLMAGPAVNLASILVVHKSMGRRFISC